MSQKQTKEYTGTCFIGVIGGEIEVGECRESIFDIIRRPGDEIPHVYRGTKGYEARQKHLNNFIESKHDFALFLDLDMYFQEDTLERLRNHKLPYISGLYMRRTRDPVAPVWYRPFSGKWPFEPWVGPVERGRLHKIGASGWGCLLIHREVVLAVKELLKGEWEIIEDDMDIWPYNLSNVMGALVGLKELTVEKPGLRTLRPALEHHVSVLEEEIKPLRADNDVVGSDVRFPFFALKAGYQFIGDPDVRPGHIIHYPISADDYVSLGEIKAQEMAHAQKIVHKKWLKARRQRMEQLENLT